MVTPQRWVARILSGCSLLSCVLIALLSGCRNQPMNPFLARENPSFEEDFENPNSELENPLADSLDRLRQRGEEFRDATAMASDAAQGLQQDSRQVARDAVAESRVALATTLDMAKQEGAQFAADAADAAGATVRQASIEAQLRTVESLEDMPLEQAGPILLLTMSQGPPAAQRAAADQLARRWPPAASYHGDLAAERRAAMIAQLRSEWSQQFGEINEAVAQAKLEAARTVDNAGQLVDEATGVVQAANQQLRDMQQIVQAYHQADVPAAAREELARSLEKISTDADARVRIEAAQAMGDTGDPVFLPALMTLLNDRPEVQQATLESLERMAGRDIAERADGKPVSNEEKARAWQLWYRDQQASVANRPE